MIMIATDGHRLDLRLDETARKADESNAAGCPAKRAVATQNLMRFNLRGEGDLVEDTARVTYEINSNTEGLGS
jgi:hypothetical protein